MQSATEIVANFSMPGIGTRSPDARPISLANNEPSTSMIVYQETPEDAAAQVLREGYEAAKDKAVADEAQHPPRGPAVTMLPPPTKPNTRPSMTHEHPRWSLRLANALGSLGLRPVALA